MCPERDLNLGLSISHRLNYEATALTTPPPRSDNTTIVSSLDEICQHESEIDYSVTLSAYNLFFIVYLKRDDKNCHDCLLLAIIY